MNSENYDPSFPDQPVIDLYIPIWANLPAFRSKPAFIWAEDGSNHHIKTSALTYTQLEESVITISTNILLRLNRRDPVVILCPPGLELVEIIFGCHRAGLLSIPLLPPDASFANQNFHHLIRVLSQTKPKAVIAHPAYISSVQNYISSSSPTKSQKLSEMLQNLTWVSTESIKVKNTNNASSSNIYNGCKPDEVYLIQYTSGSTGIPKPVLVTAGSAVHNVRFARKAYDLDPSSVIVSWLPQYHDCGLQFLLLTIISGATCVLTSPAAFVARPRIWLELISEFKANCTPVPSFAFPLVVKRGGVDQGSKPISLWSLKNLIIINEPIYEELVEEFVSAFEPYGLNPSSISPSYGLAENCTFVSTSWRNKDGNFTSFPSYRKLLPSARLDFSCTEEEEDMEIVVVNEDTHEEVRDGVEGEIWVSSPSNCAGYLDHPSLSREIFQARLTNRVSKCFVRTRDRGIIISSRGTERFLYVTGRCSDVMKLEIDNNIQELIHPHYMETAAHKSCTEFIRGGCVAAFKISNRVILVAEMQRIEKLDSRVLKLICGRIKDCILKEEGLEIGLVVLVKSGSVPKTTSGKIQRWAAKNKYIGGEMRVVMEVGFDNKSINVDGKEIEEKEKGIIRRERSRLPSLLSHL